jgi:hypothetical protein
MSVTVRGGATAEEVAAVLAVLRRPVADAPDPYERWRAGRLAALSRTASRSRAG